MVLLNQLCSILAKIHPSWNSSSTLVRTKGPRTLFIFSLLIPFIHREGTVGQQARDALLFIMSLCREHRGGSSHRGEHLLCPVSPYCWPTFLLLFSSWADDSTLFLSFFRLIFTSLCAESLVSFCCCCYCHLFVFGCAVWHMWDHSTPTRDQTLALEVQRLNGYFPFFSSKLFLGLLWKDV